jgi:hypothetical protein
MRGHLPKKYYNSPKKDWVRCRDYKSIREEAEYYRPPFNPDLSEFYGTDREIIIYEIEDRCPVSEEKKDLIESWIGVTMDGWAAWHLLLIITNRFGRGWDILIDTKKEFRNQWLNHFRKNQREFLRYHPDLDTEEKIVEVTSWRNWPFTAPLARPTIAHRFNGGLAESQTNQVP